MQKIIQRRMAAEGQALRRKIRRKAMTESDHNFQNNMRRKAQRQAQSQYIKEERSNRREDWETGPRLAPKRDLEERYGTMEQTLLIPIQKQESQRKRPWVAEGDRVVLLEGKDKGKIGRVTSVDPETETLKVKDMNQVCPTLPFIRIRIGQD